MRKFVVGPKVADRQPRAMKSVMERLNIPKSTEAWAVVAKGREYYYLRTGRIKKDVLVKMLTAVLLEVQSQ